MGWTRVGWVFGMLFCLGQAGALAATGGARIGYEKASRGGRGQPRVVSEGWFQKSGKRVQRTTYYGLGSKQFKGGQVPTPIDLPPTRVYTSIIGANLTTTHEKSWSGDRREVVTTRDTKSWKSNRYDFSTFVDQQNGVTTRRGATVRDKVTEQSGEAEENEGTVKAGATAYYGEISPEQRDRLVALAKTVLAERARPRP
jgi:hypothetical protein